MVQIRNKTHKSIGFEQLMRLGQVSHSQGDYRSAHDYWQQAAMLEPGNEQVWTALMWVLESDDDRKVCLKNILTINPANSQAKQMLDELIGDTQPGEEPREVELPDESLNRTGVDFVRVIVLGMIYSIGVSIITILLQILLN